MDKKLKVIKKGTKIEILKPCKFSENFIRYYYSFIEDEAMSLHQYKLAGIAILNPDLTEKAVIASKNVEWESAILEENVGFIGGLHGFEQNTGFSIMIDNRMVDAESDFEVECQYLRLTTESVLGRCKKPEEKTFKRCKILEWDLEHFTISNRFKLLEDFEIKRFENIMMSLPLYIDGKRFITHAATNAHPIPVSVPDKDNINPDLYLFGRDHSVTVCEEFAPDFNFYIKLEGIFDNDKYPNGNRMFDSWMLKNSNVLKVYYNMTGRHSGKKGEIFDSKAVYTIEA